MALALHALVVRAESNSDKWGDELQDRLIASEDLQALKDQVDGTMWSYLPQRLMLTLPPIDYSLGGPRAHGFAGYTLQEEPGATGNGSAHLGPTYLAQVLANIWH